MPTLERLNRLNQRVSKAKRRAEQSRAEVDQRLRGITERSERAKQSISEDGKSICREFTKNRGVRIESDFINRAKQKVERAFNLINLFKKGPKEEKEFFFR